MSEAWLEQRASPGLPEIAVRAERTVPPSAVLLALVSLVVPLVVTWLIGGRNDRLALLPWVLALTPAFLLTYYKGLRGAVVAMAAGMLALFIWTLLRSRQGLPRAPWEIQTLVVASYAALCLGLGSVVEMLHRRLEEADGGVRWDPLTGLPNRRHIELTLDAAATSARAEKRDLSVVLVDVDHFTWLVEAHGRSAGDRVVVAIAELLDDLSGSSWQCGRTGHDALVAILPDTDRNGALRVAETVRKGATSLDLPWQPLSISVGVATLYGPVLRGRQLLEDAERSLTRAKALGRDRVEVAAGQSSLARPSMPHVQMTSGTGSVGIVALPAASRSPMRRVLEISGLRVIEFDDPRHVRLRTGPGERPVVVVTAIPRLAQLDGGLWSLSSNIGDTPSLVVFVADAAGTDRLPERPGVTLLKGRPTAEGLLPVIGGVLADARADSALRVKPVVGGFESGLSGKDAPLTSARILIVDDEERTRRVLQRTREAIGFRDIVAVSSGEEALALVAEHPPDAIILDLQMPEMDGFAVLDLLGPLLEGDGFRPSWW